MITNKGGVGKTLVSFNLAQYLRDHGRPVQVIDIDPMNHTLSTYTGLHAKKIKMLNSEHTRIQGDDLDALAVSMLEQDADFVIDNGASGFVQLSHYLIENDLDALLRERNRTLLIHAVIPGGDMSIQCILGLDAIFQAFPATVKVVVWLNEHFGPVQFEGGDFEQVGIYKDNVARIAGLVHMRALPDLFLKDFKAMQEARLTYQEAIDSPKFHIMNKSRIFNIRRPIWQQLEQIL